MRTKAAQPRSSSKKTRKGIVAGVAGIALLAGGSASFATWSDAFGTKSSAIKAGVLDLEPVAKSATWTGANGEIINPSAVRLVPGGAAVTYNEQVKLKAEGEGITAELTPRLGTFSKLPGVVYTVRVQEDVAAGGINFEWHNGTTATEQMAMIEAGEQKTLNVTVTISLDKATAGNTTQGKALTFSGVGIDVKQI
ncbi:alternate-type signal peptide domain-containing protein [Georgenia yuyongxinii]|uniref:Alternate-type signal peptide domain-containing protein n=1 Tax=Georgenia yuyongxinii TaxID=2589797 RepID=A0A552WMC1_9MICO|nr:alternate-type signal peptide domain-containing protein [Georgenia yuyongxinii]TRW43921.1 alternate-type signal peptide domain-containing protein [Georgenia yuyongxinii]